ncbi:heme NO-binding domain-containing protein [Maritimibacter dapengensis]|uniref:Heme NO-binding domain-containing protein n=1 Tax=Maritimibacter dapengensis TaxID=2836868 RepID=A0ABS6SYU4_9RHOB|nr:heme NO-binding domain-containing protein [Maritimibacter dapengensis]MBV7378095.1 heme NO-binding domain-containing protein [Maritimibacter dapengensis]
MHGLICRSFEGFVRSAYGSGVWQRSMISLDAGIDGFEGMLHYHDDLAERLVTTCARELYKPRDVLLEDFGTFVVAGSGSGRLRRLLRFGGVDYEDFLHSLDDLAGRAALAVPDIGLPDLELVEADQSMYDLICRHPFRGVGFVIMGLLRALADDYGVLVLLEHLGPRDNGEALSILLLETDYAEDRGFDLSEAVGAVASKSA